MADHGIGVNIIRIRMQATSKYSRVNIAGLMRF